LDDVKFDAMWSVRFVKGPSSTQRLELDPFPPNPVFGLKMDEEVIFSTSRGSSQ